MERFRKILAFGTIFVTVLSMSVVTVPNAGATASAGDLIKMSGLSSVYYLAADGKRYVFPNESTYKSWYSDFSGVITIPQTELEGYPLGANVTMRPGTKLVKITTDPKVYAVEPNGSLKHIASETAASTLYGSNWAQRIVDVPDAFFTNYTVASGQLDGTAYPTGSLIKSATAADVYYIASDGKAQKITTEAAFTANRFAWGNVLTSTLAIPAAGTDITGTVATLTDTSSGAGGVAGAGTGLTVSLSANTAAASTLVDNQANANMATFNFTASNDGAVKVTSLKLKRIGIGQDTTLPAIYLYDGSTRLTDSASVSSTYITFNNSAGIFTVDKGATKSITVKSNIANSTAGQTVGIQIVAAADVTTDGASVSGTFPVSGNIHSIADGSLGSVSFASTVTPATNTALDPQDDFTLWQNTVSVGTRAASLENVTFRQIGSILQADLQKFRLYIDGVQIGSTVEQMDSSGYITFDLSASPKSLTAADHTFKILVNIVGGSSRTTSLSLQRTVDATFIDSEYNVPILIQANSSTFSARSSGTQTISNGTLTITKKTDSTSGNVVKGASNVTLASYEFRAAGESIKVETVRANVIVNDGTIDKLRNGKIYANGVQVGSTADLYAADGSSYYTEYSMGSSLIVSPTSPVTVEIKADIYDSDGTDNTSAGDTLQAQIASSTSNAQRQVALTYISVPGSDTPGNSLSVQTGSLTCSKYSGYTNHSKIVPQTTAQKLADFRCTAGSTEDITVTSLSFDVDGSTGNIDAAASSRYDIYDAYIIYGASTGATKSTIASTSNAWNVNTTVAKNGTITVAFYGKLKSTIGSGATINVDLNASGTAAGSNTSVTAAEADGQTITIGSGSIATAATENPLDQYALGGQTVTAATYDITATNDTYTVEQIGVKFTDLNVLDAIVNVTVYDGDTLLGSQVPNSSGIASTTGLSLSVPANTTKTITVKIELNSVGSGVATPGRNASTTLDGILVRSSAGTESSVDNDRQGNNVFVYKNYPVVSQVELTSAERQIINNSSQAVYKFKIAPAGTGSVGLKQVALALTWTELGTAMHANGLILDTLKLFRGSTDITSLVQIVDNKGANLTNSGGGATSTTQSVSSTGVFISWLDGTEEQISADTTYTVKATPKNFDSGTTSKDSVSISLSGDTSAHNGVSLVYVGKGMNLYGGGIYGLATSTTGSHTDYNFIWSDRSSVGHISTSGSSTGDWANGYQVKNLPLDPTVMSM